MKKRLRIEIELPEVEAAILEKLQDDQYVFCKRVEDIPMDAPMVTSAEIVTTGVRLDGKLPDDLAEELGRDMVRPHVVYWVNRLVEEGRDLKFIDDYLLDEAACTQDEREFIVECLTQGGM